MITRADIRQETNSASYSRGLQLWRSGSVRKMDVEEKEQIPGETEMEIRAEVLGSTGNFYQVQIAVDEKEEKSSRIRVPARLMRNTGDCANIASPL